LSILFIEKKNVKIFLLTDNAQVANLQDSIKEIGLGIEDEIHEIGDKMKNITEKVIPSCVFGVKSVSMVLFTR